MRVLRGLYFFLTSQLIGEENTLNSGVAEGMGRKERGGGCLLILNPER
jgi:hypothetical protein